ncbi:MAG: AAA family ATPase [Planctomycetota bacterium]|nr:AAA family ATPase [Planctomycetota bacterium]
MLAQNDQPVVVVVAGPNGAGKTTIAREVLASTLGIAEFVNADVIASGLSGFNPESAAFPAGRVMLTRIKELAALRASFAFESTLASRTFAPWLKESKDAGYSVHIVYVMLESADLAVRRVRARVLSGGHAIPEDTVRRRFGRSAANFISMYMPLADTWIVLDNSRAAPRLVAAKTSQSGPNISRLRLWNRLEEIAGGGTTDQRAEA